MKCLTPSTNCIVKLFSVAQTRPRDCVARPPVTSVGTVNSQNGWGGGVPLLLDVHPRPPGPPSMGMRVACGGQPLSRQTLGPSLPSTLAQREALRPCLVRRQGRGKRHRRLVGMHVMEWTSELTSKHGTHGRAWRRGTRDKGGTTDRGACLGVEIPTIIIFQIQRLLVSEQRNNKFNQRWSLKERK